MDHDKRIADYFVVAGLSPDCHVQSDEFVGQEGGCSPKVCQSHKAPITDITVIIRSQGETVPEGFNCIETTPGLFPADLNHGSLRSPQVYLCYRRGYDKPPLVDIGILYEGKERVMADSEVVHTTMYGRPANVNNSGSRIFFTYRRARENAPCNQLVVTDICVILANKAESPPHAFCLIDKNLNKGIVGSDVYVCYKKSMNRPPLLCFKSTILDRFPLEDYPHYSLPESVPLFCFPMGATVECWPLKSQQPKPVFSTFVLTSNLAEKVYGAAITFYEIFYDENNLSDEEKIRLTYWTEEDKQTKSLHTIKSICILSRWPFFDTFEKYLLFLHRTVIASNSNPSKIPIERFISHFMLDVPFPSPQRPKILVQLGNNINETVMISQPPEYLSLPLSGASFSTMLRNLGAENCINVLLFVITEQKILLHSLRPDVLTSVAEAVVNMIFPLRWQCPYIPLCPLGLCDVLNAPLPFIVGVDSRYFDNFEPPYDVASIDLDTNSIYMSESRRHINTKLLPKKATRILKTTLERLFERLSRPNMNWNSSNGTYGSQVKAKSASPNLNNENSKKLERQIDLEIQEGFIRFMASILKNFRLYLLPITRVTVGATDTSSLFDLEGFLKSRDKNYHKFYNLMFQTQMFTRFIEERSFVTDKDTSLAFFDECSEKLEAFGDSSDGFNSLRLIEIDDAHQNDRTVFIAPPELHSENEQYSYKQFGPLNPSLYHRHPRINKFRSSLLSYGENGQAINTNPSGSPITKRTKQEIRLAQKFARRQAESPKTWTKCLISYCYSLWFVHLPAYANITTELKGNPLDIAYKILLRMRSLNLQPPDEVCYRILMLLCGVYNQPALAVKVLYEMKRSGVHPNAITYGYYNKAVLESKWPTDDTTGTLMWNKLRNVVFGVAKFKKSGQLWAERNRNSSEDNASSLNDSNPNLLKIEKACQSSSPKTTEDDKISHDSSVSSETSGTTKSSSKSSNSTSTKESSDSGSSEDSNEQSNNTTDIMSSFTPLKDAIMNLEIFSPEGKVASTLRSSFRLASRLTKSAGSSGKSSISKSLTFNSPEQNPHEKSFARLGSLFRKESSKKIDFGTPMKIMSRSATLPAVSPSKHVIENHALRNDALRNDALRNDALSQLNDIDETDDIPIDSNTLKNNILHSNSGSPWTNKFTSNKHSEYVYSTIKSAASNMANKFSGFKSSLTTSSVNNSPSKNPVNISNSNSSVATMASGTASLLSQWANLVVEKLPANFVFDDDETGSMNSLDQIHRRSSFLVSEDDQSEKSREGSIASSSTSILFDLLEKHPSINLEPLSVNSEIIFEILIASCSRCPTCLSLLFEHQIMDGWSADDSNLNTRCCCCKSRFVPVLTIKAKDLRNNLILSNQLNTDEKSNEKSDEKSDENNINEKIVENGIHDNEDDEKEVKEYMESDDFNLKDLFEFDLIEPVTVPYLCPLVLRKEIEYVLDHEGDLCLVNSNFLDHHPIIFWNLIWYFKRVNLPTHLPGLCLTSDTFNKDKQVSDVWKSYDHRNVGVEIIHKTSDKS